MRTGQLGARALTEAYIQHLSEVDRSGPAINSIIEMNPMQLRSPSVWTSALPVRCAGRCTGCPCLLKTTSTRLIQCRRRLVRWP